MDSKVLGGIWEFGETAWGWVIRGTSRLSPSFVRPAQGSPEDTQNLRFRVRFLSEHREPLETCLNSRVSRTIGDSLAFFQ